MIWKAVVYAASEEAHLDVWAFLLERFPEQEAAITYIQNTWLPWQRQFVSCWTSEIPNFGVRVTSRTEANHREIKGYLYNSTADLKFLAERVELMVENRQWEYRKSESDEAARQLNDYHTRIWMGDTRSRCSRHALKLFLEQYRLAVVTTKERGPLAACTGRFRLQFGIPCSHEIKAKEATHIAFSYLDIYPHWHLGHDLYEEDRLCHILDPIVVLSSRGRPQLAPEDIPTALIPRGTNRRHQAAEARAREPSEWEIEEAHARERQHEVVERFEQQQQRQHGCEGARGQDRGIARGTTRAGTGRGASRGTAARSGPTDEALAELERDIKADLARWGCEEVAALLEPGG